MWFLNLLFLAGAIKILFRLCQFVQNAFLYKECPDYELKYGKNSWVIVTGATDGIGWGYCIELAKRKLNVILVSRTESKLKSREIELKEMFPDIQTKILAFDFTEKFNQNDYELLFKNVEKLDICGVVNNVGIMTPLTCSPFVREQAYCTKDQYKKGDKEFIDMIKVNIQAQTNFYHHFIPKLKVRSHRSFVIDISSISAIYNDGVLSVYAATKAFNHFQSLAESETNNTNVDFLCVKPGPVETLIFNVGSEFVANLLKKQLYATVTVEECVVGSLKVLGNHNESFGAFKHEIFGMFAEFMNSIFPLNKFLRYVINFFEKARKHQQNKPEV